MEKYTIELNENEMALLFRLLVIADETGKPETRTNMSEHLGMKILTQYLEQNKEMRRDSNE